jgi:para-nitrobenzyl esterase
MTSYKSFTILAVIAVIAACSASKPGSTDAMPGDATQVTIETGTIRGVQVGDAIYWKGIPYATPPVGSLRWKPPQPASAWNGIRDASSFGATCVQLSTSGEILGGDEDCLTVNIWTPAHPTGPLPVMVWIHGGYYIYGASSKVTYDGAYLAEHGPAIIVTLNYRLGALGFLAHPQLTAESPMQSSGNYGLLDQIAALRWVQRNVASFGGDPSNVTIFGQSAGGLSVCNLLTSPLASGLFARALIESGGCTVPDTLASAEAAGGVAAHNLGCDAAPDALACLRAQPAADVATSLPWGLAQGFRWRPIVDGWVLTEPPLTAMRGGRWARVPLIAGNTANEYAQEIALRVPQPVTTDTAYRQALAQVFGASYVDRIAAVYPSASYASPQDALVAATSDAIYVCHTRRILRAAASTGAPAVWRYDFAHHYDAMGAYHAIELPYVFHVSSALGRSFTTDEDALSNAIVGYWTRFATTGDPNGAGAPAWTQNLGDAYLVFDDSISQQAGWHTSQCDFWDAL